MPEKQKITSNAKINPATKIIYPDVNNIQVDSSIEGSDGTTPTIESDESRAVPKNFREKIIKFIKLDDLIREETIAYKEKMETLKSQKEEVSGYILRHLEDVGEKEIDLETKGKISKYTSTRKSGLNKDIIQQSIYEKLKNDKLVKTDDEGRMLAQATYEIMEGKREVKTKVTLKRTIKREKKQKNVSEQHLEKNPKKVNKK
jgi:uncharacterized protein YjhX (UPF0386 family)